MSEAILCCPLPGPPPDFSGDCESCKTFTWLSPGVGELYFFTPYNDKQLFGFEFTPGTNNGSTITVELYYCKDGVCQVWKTWNLGTLTSPTEVYSTIDYGKNPVFNTFALRITTTNGTSGNFQICLDCEIPINILPACTGFSYNAAAEVCECTGTTIQLFSEVIEILPGRFPLALAGRTWYLEPELQNPAPCGDYLFNGVVYTYNCANSSSRIKSFCDPCPAVECTATTKSYQYTQSAFTKSNPYLLGVTDGLDRGAHFYSEQCLNIVVGPEQPELGFLTIGLNYTGSPDSIVATISDPTAPNGQVGVLSYALSEPPVSMFFQALPTTLIKVPSGGQVIYVTLPLSRAVRVRILAGYKFNNQVRPNVTTSISWTGCTTPISGFTVGLHAYSAYDSINNPKLKTVLYSYQGSPDTWAVNDTVYADSFLTQPAFPYFYGYSGNGSNQKVIKVGEIYRREWGRKRSFRTSQLKFKYKFEQVVSDYKNWSRVDNNGEYRVQSCVDPFMDIGKISMIVNKNDLLQPTRYYYLMGRHPSTIWAANNDYFYRTDFTLNTKKTGKKVPLTGMEHALWRASEALSSGLQRYALSWNDAAQIEVLKKRGRSTSRVFAWGSSILTAIIIAVGFIVDPAGTASSLAGFALGKFLKQNPNIAAGLGGAAALLGKAVKSLGRELSTKYNNSGKALPRKGPLQWLWHNTVHRVFGERIEGPASKCPYECTNASKGNLAWKDLTGFGVSLALMGLDRLYSSGYTRTFTEICDEFYGRFTTAPYINTGLYNYKLSGLTTPEVGYNCDGAYFYTMDNNGLVTNKQNAYKSEFKKRFLKPPTEKRIITPLPDVPTFVTEFDKMVFLPYTSGRPYRYVGYTPTSLPDGDNFLGWTYYNYEKTSTWTPPTSIVGELNNPLPITMTIPERYFFSNTSQLDADTKAENYLSGYTAATYYNQSSAESKPGLTDDVFYFSHRLEVGPNMNFLDLNYIDETQSGLQVGTKLYYDEDGIFHALSGYFSTTNSGETYFKKFYQVNSGGTIVDIWTMSAESATTVTSQETSQTVSLETEFSGFTSGWYLNSDDAGETEFSKFYNNHNFSEIWGTQEFYDSPFICRGFMDNDGLNIFNIYTSNIDIEQGYSSAEPKFYREINSWYTFLYVTDYTIYIDTTEICYPSGTTSGDTGIMFSLRDSSGNTVSSVYGISFNAEVYYSGTSNTTHKIVFTENDFEYFLSLDPIYQGNITGVTITEYLTYNPYNTILFTGGTFTPCGECIIAGSAEVPATFTLEAGSGLRFDYVAVDNGEMPSFTYPLTGTASTSMVSNYSDNTVFQAVITGVRTGGTNKTVKLFVNDIEQSCELISADLSYYSYYLESTSAIDISDDVKIKIESTTSC